MTRLGRRLAVTSACVFAFVLVTAPSYADGLQRCLDKAVDHNGEPPTCTQVNGKWVASWPDDSSPASGVAGFFGVIVVLGLIAGVGITIWKVSTARRLATQSGMDPGLATGMTLLTNDGLDATYLAASLRGPARRAADPAVTPTPAPGASASSRLEELKGLLDRGLVTQEEYDARRQAIIDSV